MKTFRTPLVIFGAWLLLFADVSPAIVVAGLLCALFGTLFMRLLRADVDAPGAAAAARRAGLPRMLLALLLFIPFFVFKVLSSGANIAHLALAPSMDFWPGIVRIKGNLPTLNHTALFACLITLTPGTLTLDYDEKGDHLYVHWIDVTGYGDADMDARVTSGLRAWVRRILG